MFCYDLQEELETLKVFFKREHDKAKYIRVAKSIARKDGQNGRTVRLLCGFKVSKRIV